MFHKKSLIIILTVIFSAVVSGCSNIDDLNTSIYEKITVSMTLTSRSESIRNEEVWHKLYNDELEKYTEVLEKDNYSYNANYNLQYNIYDLDGNGIPELIISKGDYHATSVAIYTVYEEKLVHYGDFGAWGEIQYDPINRYILSANFGQGEFYKDFYKIENNKMIIIASFYNNAGYTEAEGELIYKVNDNPVSKEEYEIEYKKFILNDFSDIARKYSIN